MIKNASEMRAIVLRALTPILGLLKQRRRNLSKIKVSVILEFKKWQLTYNLTTSRRHGATSPT